MLYEKYNGVAVVTFNRPEDFNALRRGMNKQFIKIINDVESENAVKVVVLNRAGANSFITGGEIKEIANLM